MPVFDIGIVADYLPLFLQGAWVTIQVVLTAVVLSTVFGYFVAMMRRSGNKLLRGVAATYVWIFRGLPLILSLFFFYYALPQYGIRLDAYTAGVAAMTINSTAFFSEIIRAGLNAVPKGQVEAAVSIGMTPWKTVTRVTIPTTIRLMLPPYINNSVIMLKESAQLAVITVPDLMFQAQRAYNATYRPMETLAVAGVLYLTITSGLMLVQVLLERRQNGSKGKASRAHT